MKRINLLKRSANYKGLRKGFIDIATLLLVSAFILGTISIGPLFPNDPNPSNTIIRAYLKEMALKYNIPSVILMSIAYTESGWRQFDASGNPIINYNSQTSFDIGIMQINSVGRNDIDKLKTDIFYNIEVGAKILDGKWKITPGIGDRDKNILENWYYSIWAYNGFSYTNHPQNPDGRHYQDKVINNLSRLILGSDGQPLWMPIKITKPDPLSISNPPQWIPTPIPYNYGDLYSGMYEGNNAKLLEGFSDIVVPVGKDFTLAFLMQNVGTTTWIKGNDCHMLLTISRGNFFQEYTDYIASNIVAGDAYAFKFNMNIESIGTYDFTLKMFSGDQVFGSKVRGSLEVSDAKAMENTSDYQEALDIGQPVKVKFDFQGADNLKPFVDISLTNQSGNVVYSTILQEDITNDLLSTSFVPISQLTFPGTYQLKERLILFNGDIQELSDFSLCPSYLEVIKPFTLNQTNQTGIMLDSAPRSGHIFINGVDTGLFTPTFVALPPSSYSISIAKDGFDTFVTQKDVKGLDFLLCNLNPKIGNLALVPSQSNIDFGTVQNDESKFKSLSISFSGVLSTPLIASADSKYLTVFPLTATTASNFTISIDSRWLSVGGSINGKITFKTSSSSVEISVTANVLSTNAKIYLLPDRATIREGESLQIQARLCSQTYPINVASFFITYDTSLIKFDNFFINSSLFFSNLHSFSTDFSTTVSQTSEGRIEVSFNSQQGFLGDDQIASFNFMALKKSTGTLITCENAQVLSNGQEIVVITNPSNVSILEKLNLPSIVRNLSTEALIGKIQLDFIGASQGSYPLENYEIFRSKDASVENAIYIGNTITTVFVDNGPLERVAYYYWVISVDSMGNSSSPVGPVSAIPLIFSDSLPRYVKLEFYIGKPFIFINGIQMPMDVAPFIVNGRTFVAVRYIAEPFGAQVIWNGKTQQVTLIHKKLIELWIEKPIALIDGIETPIDEKDPTITPFIKNGRTMLPLRFVSENLGATVGWDTKLQKVTIDYKN